GIPSPNPIRTRVWPKSAPLEWPMDWLKPEASGFGCREGPDRNCGSVAPRERLAENSVSKPCPRIFIVGSFGVSSLVQPHVLELSAEIVARRHLPAHHHLMGWNNSMPPQQRLLIALLEQPLFEGADERLALLRIALTHMLLIELVELGILGFRHVLRRPGEEFRQRERGVVHEQVGEVDRHVEV